MGKEGGDKEEVKPYIEATEERGVSGNTGFFTKFSSQGTKRKPEDSPVKSTYNTKKIRSSEVVIPQETIMSSQETEDFSQETEDINVSHCPSDYDATVWQELPPEVRMEVLEERRRGGGGSGIVVLDEAVGKGDSRCPESSNQEVFDSLPEEIKSELIQQERQQRQRETTTKNKLKPPSIMSYFQKSV